MLTTGWWLSNDISDVLRLFLVHSSIVWVEFKAVPTSGRETFPRDCLRTAAITISTHTPWTSWASWTWWSTFTCSEGKGRELSPLPQDFFTFFITTENNCKRLKVDLICFMRVVLFGQEFKIAQLKDNAWHEIHIAWVLLVSVKNKLHEQGGWKLLVSN